MREIIVVGGGASGVFAAGCAAEQGAKVTLLEKNPRIARKVLISGKGRCNVTNYQTDVKDLLSAIPVNGRFLYSAFARFMPEDTMAHMEGLGVPLKVERGNRVFPVSDKAVDIVDAMDRYLRKCGVKRIMEDIAVHLVVSEGKIVGVETRQHGILKGDAVILCTGGASYPRTGSTGDGYKLAAEVGHTITDIKPSLIPLVSPDPSCKEMQGLSLRNVSLKLISTDKKKPLYEELGELLFTHFGISGPLVLSASSHIRNIEPGKYTVVLDLKPGLSEDQLDKRIQRDFTANTNKEFQNALGKLLPATMVPVIVRKSGITPTKKVNQITKEERQALVTLFKHYEIPISGFRPIEEAIVTSGGISVKEINPGTMESKLISGLYFAGELIDVDAYTGGYNLQIAFSTGTLAGKSAAQEDTYV